MANLVESNFEDSGDVMPEHVGHQSICIFPIVHTKGHRNVLNNFNVGEEKKEGRMKHVDIKVFLLLPRGLSKQ